jgi:zinc finger protein
MASLPDGDSWKQGNEDDISIIHKCFCPNCHGGIAETTMLPTKVPLFREIILMNLTCDDCGFRNAEVNFGGEIQVKGERLTLKVVSLDDLNRQVIKSDSASLFIPKLDFEIPPGTQRGTISTLEGVLKRAAENLELVQPERLRLGDVDNFHRCRVVIASLLTYAGEPPEASEDGGEKGPESIFPFDIIMDDPAGNSFVENPMAPKADPYLKSEKYYRTPNQDMSLGLQPSEQAVEAGKIDDANPEHKNIANVGKGKHSIETDKKNDREAVGRQEVIKFETQCPHCHILSETDMCVVDIPHFKEVIIMSMVCESCGFKSNEIKGGGAIPKFGTKISLTVRSQDDLAREVLKSDTAGIAIPELELELQEGGLDGVYTSIEGLLNKMRDRLASANPFGSGDSAKKQHLSNDGGDFSGMSPTNVRYMAFLAKLKDMADGVVLPFTLVISDPLSNSFVGPVQKDAIALSLQAEKEGNTKCYENYEDADMYIEEYERSNQQNEDLGLNDIKTENYQQEGDRQDYGTNSMDDLPDRLRRLDVRGPDHPHLVGKAPVQGDNTVMGVGSNNFAVPSMGKRGQIGAKVVPQPDPNLPVLVEKSDVRKMIHSFEYNDDSFIMNEEYEGAREGMVYKDGAQGVGYYTDVNLVGLWETHTSS